MVNLMIICYLERVGPVDGLGLVVRDGYRRQWVPG